MTADQNISNSSNNSSGQNPRFTGFFMPVEILEMTELSCTEIIVLAWIDALYCKEKGGCFATNKFLAKYARIKEGSVINILTKFRRLGLIEDVQFDGRHRVIRACIHKKSYEQQTATYEQSQPTYEQFGPSYEQDMESASMYRGGDPILKGGTPHVHMGSDSMYRGGGVPPSHYNILYSNIYKKDRKYINAQTGEQTPSHHPTQQIKFSFESSQFENITQVDLSAWKDLYPDLDINRQLKEMTQWILSNPSKAKHKKLWRKFIVTWLQRSYEKITNRVVYQQASRISAVERNTFPDKDPRPYKAKKTIILEDEDLPSLSNGKTQSNPFE